MKSILIMASGQGSNARAIIRYFEERDDACVNAILSDRESVGLRVISGETGVPYIKFDYESDAALLELTKEYSADFIVLAGYLRKIPPSLIAAYPSSIVNLHPSLLPLYGGKGMYGARVHRAVLEDGAKRSGVSIHLVDEEYDRGPVLLQASCPVMENDDVASLSKRVQALEHRYYPFLIETLLP